MFYVHLSFLKKLPYFLCDDRVIKESSFRWGINIEQGYQYEESDREIE